MNKTNLLFGNLKLLVPQQQGAIYVYYSEIYYIVSDRPYIKISGSNKLSLIANESIKSLENQLPGNFFQCNKSSIINFSHVTRYRFHDNKQLYVVMSDGTEFTVSRRREKAFFEKEKFLFEKNYPSVMCSNCKKEDCNFEEIPLCMQIYTVEPTQ